MQDAAKKYMHTLGSKRRYISKSAQASHSVENQTDRVRSKKGPPARPKGLIILQQFKNKMKTLAREEDDVTDNDSEYYPSNSDSDSFTSDSFIVSDSEVCTNLPDKNSCSDGSTAWHEVKGSNSSKKLGEMI